MKRLTWTLAAVVPLLALWFLNASSLSREQQDLLWHYRNLGKAFYENPTTQKESVAEFKKALDLAPDSARERVNYGLALLRAGQTKDGIVELEKAQQRDPAIPHTWFNLGIALKKEGDYEKAIHQLEGMAKLVPDEPVTHYNLGVLNKLAGKGADALEQLEIAEKLNPNLAGPQFQLFNQYRHAVRADESARELKVCQELLYITTKRALFKNETRSWRRAVLKRRSGWITTMTAIWTCCCSAQNPRSCAITAKPASVIRPRIFHSLMGTRRMRRFSPCAT